jgi:hypothetical protein
MTTTEQPSWTCPVCEMTTHNPNDIREGYCGNCHAVTVGRTSLKQHMAWLESIGQVPGCTCRFQWKSLGRGHGQGWVRMNTAKDCPEHGPDGAAAARSRRRK